MNVHDFSVQYCFMLAIIDFNVPAKAQNFFYKAICNLLWLLLKVVLICKRILFIFKKKPDHQVELF